jgi:hypothetical protein
MTEARHPLLYDTSFVVALYMARISMRASLAPHLVHVKLFCLTYYHLQPRCSTTAYCSQLDRVPNWGYASFMFEQCPQRCFCGLFLQLRLCRR